MYTIYKICIFVICQNFTTLLFDTVNLFSVFGLSETPASRNTNALYLRGKCSRELLLYILRHLRCLLHVFVYVFDIFYVIWKIYLHTFPPITKCLFVDEPPENQALHDFSSKYGWYNWNPVVVILRPSLFLSRALFEKVCNQLISAWS